MMPSSTLESGARDIARRIVVIRGQRVLLDTDLASLYGVTVRRLNEQFRRNRKRFPEGFIFHLTFNELRTNWSQIATSSKKYRGPARLPLAFTEHGAIMAATILSSARAVEMTVYVVRAFVKLRELVASNADLARKLEVLEKSVATLDAKTRQQFEEVYLAIRALMAPPAVKSRPIGFTADVDEKP